MRTAQNPLLLRSNDDTGKWSKPTFSETVDINQDLATIQGAFIQRKWLNLGKHIALCHFFVVKYPQHTIYHFKHFFSVQQF